MGSLYGTSFILLFAGLFTSTWQLRLKPAPPVVKNKPVLLEYDGKHPEGYENFLKKLSWNYGGYNEEPPEPEIEPQSQRLNWNPTGYGEVPFLTVLYKFTSHSKGVYQTSLSPGNACGAVLLSPTRILSLCQCVLSWYRHGSERAYHVLTRDRRANKYDIFHNFIYAFFPGVNFEPDFSVLLGASEKGQCDAYNLDIAFIALKFNSTDPAKKPLAPINPDLVVPWNPIPTPRFGELEKSFHEPPTTAFVSMYATGPTLGHAGQWQFYSELGQEIEINTTAITVGLIEESLHHVCMPAIKPNWKKEKYENQRKWTENCSIACFQADYTTQVCGGLPGFPIVDGGTLLGLNAYPLDCHLFYTLLVPFDTYRVHKIEEVIGEREWAMIQEWDEEEILPNPPKTFEEPLYIANIWSKGPKSRSAADFAKSGVPTIFTPSFLSLVLTAIIYAFPSTTHIKAF